MMQERDKRALECARLVSVVMDETGMTRAKVARNILNITPRKLSRYVRYAEGLRGEREPNPENHAPGPAVIRALEFYIAWQEERRLRIATEKVLAEVIK